MKTKLFKLNDGYEIPLIGFGTYKITNQCEMDIAIDTALNCGYRMFDTAKLYENESQLGNSLEKFLPKYNLKREDIYITTKYQPPVDNTNQLTNEYIETSLRNLKTQYINLVLIHYPKNDLRTNEDPQNYINRKNFWLCLQKISECKVHSIGVSNFEINHIEELKENSLKIPAVNQIEYHPHFIRSNLKKYCETSGIFFQAFSSLTRQNPELINNLTVSALAKKYNTTVQVILLSFAVSQNVGVIPKSCNPERIKENFKVAEIFLSKEDIDSLNALDQNKNYIRTTGWLVK